MRTAVRRRLTTAAGTAGGVLVAILVLGPWIAGLRFESELPHVLARISQPGTLRLEVAHHERGWFRSTVTTRGELGTPVPGVPDATERFTLEHRVVHGPLPFVGARVRLALAAVETEPTFSGTWRKGPDADEPLLRATTWLGLTGAVTSHVRVAPVDLAQVSGGAVAGRWEGLAGTVTVSRRADRLSYRFRGPQLKAQVGTQTVVVRDVDAKGTQARGPEGLWAGRQVWRAAALTGGANGIVDAWAVADPHLVTTAAVAAERYEQRFEVGLDEVRAGDRTTGPASCAFTLRNVPVAPLVELQAAARDAGLAAGTAGAEVLLAAFRRILDGRPRLAIEDCTAETPEGRAEAVGRLELAERASDDGSGGSWMARLVADLRLTVPERLLDGQGLAMVMFQRTGERLQTVLHYENGTLTVNGEPLDVPVVPPGLLAALATAGLPPAGGGAGGLPGVFGGGPSGGAGPGGAGPFGGLPFPIPGGVGVPAGPSGAELYRQLYGGGVPPGFDAQEAMRRMAAIERMERGPALPVPYGGAAPPEASPEVDAKQVLEVEAACEKLFLALGAEMWKELTAATSRGAARCGATDASGVVRCAVITHAAERNPRDPEMPAFVLGGSRLESCQVGLSAIGSKGIEFSQIEELGGTTRTFRVAVD